jgi:antitoxin VapB
MAIYIKNTKAESLAREVANRYGLSLTEAVISALESKLKEPYFEVAANNRLVDELQDIGQRCSRLPDLDTQSADTILGYNDLGVSS